MEGVDGSGAGGAFFGEGGPVSFEDSLDVRGFTEDTAEGERAHSLAQEGRERQASAGGGHFLKLGLRAPVTDDISICINDFHSDTKQLVAVPGQEFDWSVKSPAATAHGREYGSDLS
jgi:hypothetical protein